MQYLKSKVNGEAEKLIQHLEISTVNYDACWDILNNRYNNKKLIFTSYMNNLMNIPAAQQPSVASLKRLHDTTVETVNAIKNLGIDVGTWDPLLIYFLAQKLDPETHNDYITAQKQPRDLPALKDFLAFIECKFTALETTRRKPENIERKPEPQNHYNNQSSSRFMTRNTYTNSSNNNRRLVQFAASNNTRNQSLNLRCVFCKIFLSSINGNECVREKRCDRQPKLVSKLFKQSCR